MKGLLQRAAQLATQRIEQHGESGAARAVTPNRSHFESQNQATESPRLIGINQWRPAGRSYTLAALDHDVCPRRLQHNFAERLAKRVHGVRQRFELGGDDPKIRPRKLPRRIDVLGIRGRPDLEQQKSSERVAYDMNHLPRHLLGVGPRSGIG
jgi:hypothetical protein